MKIDLKMPQMGESLTEGTILKWWKKIGDPVEKDETILEISTDKVDSEIPSPAKGMLAEILVEENQTVPVGTVIARIETGAEATVPAAGIAEVADKAASESAVKESALPPEQTLPAEKEIATKEKVSPQRPPGEVSRPKGDRFYSPLVLNIARKEGISMAELETIPGSGSGGRVTKKDILKYLSSRQATPKTGEMPGTAVISNGGRELVIPMDSVRKKIAVHMRQSLDTSAHVYSVSECDMTGVMELMYTKRPLFEKEEGFKLTVTPFILYAVTRALLDFPRLNSSLQGDNIIEKKYIHLGIAVAAPKGLIVPVVKNAEEKSFRGLARAVNDLVTRTRQNKLTVEDVQGTTFTVTNYGIFGNIMGFPIINQPNVAILGIGAIKKKPVVVESSAGDAIAIRSIAYISMSYDHRVVDGELGGRFMQRLVEYLENIPPDII